MNRNLVMCVVAAGVLLLIGLVIAGRLSPTGGESVAAAADPRYLLSAEPPGADEVNAVRDAAQDQDDVVVVGRIGGRVDPWIKDSAAFSIVDRSRKPCSEIPGDTCETPWDYCCEADLPKSTLLVMLHDVDGKLVKQDARSLLGVKELDTVVISGKAKRDKDGNVSIVASKIYVAPNKKAPTP